MSVVGVCFWLAGEYRSICPAWGGETVFRAAALRPNECLMEEPDEDAVERPTESKEDAEEAYAWMAKEWTGIALISIGSVLLLALVLMAPTGLADFVGQRPVVQVVVLGALALLLLGGFAWSRRGV